MKNRKNIKRKLNNKGLTLIEILIAMTLLTIAIVPMMRGFIQVNRYGEKGRNLQQATTIAQTAMENCKAYNIADIHNKMTNDSFMDSGALYMVGADYENDGVGSYFIDNMTVDGRKVGMSIKLSPINATKQDITKYENCNPRLDGIFVASQTTYNDGTNDIDFHTMESTRFDQQLEYIANKIEQEVLVQTGQTVNITVEELRENLFDVNSSSINLGVIEFIRDITITALTDTNGDDIAKVRYEYTAVGMGNYVYSFPDGTTVSVNLSSTTFSTPDVESTIYTNSYSKSQNGKLERIYFYYYPAYNSGLYTENPCVKDEITIDTTGFKNGSGDPKDLDVYLIKQKRPLTSDILLELAEEDTNYKNYVRVKTAQNGSLNGKVNLYHNFNVNIGDESDMTPSWPEIGELVLEGGAICDNKSGLAITEQKELMYTITIKMYTNPVLQLSPTMEMTGEEILTLDGTKVNW